MSIPQVAIVGRPNVGKSSLFNWLAGRRIAIVDQTSGVTRDRLTALIEWQGRYCEISDTGGLGMDQADDLAAEVRHQIELALDQADAVLFVVDARDGLVPLDDYVAGRLRSVNKPVLCVANKCDGPEQDHHSADFCRLGYDQVVPVSALHHRNKRELLSRLWQLLPAREFGQGPRPAEMKVAIVGRRNAGKSTFVNALARAERVIVSEMPGTTRDAVDVRFELDGKAFIAIDTAGLRRKRSIDSDLDFYSMTRAERSIRRADVTLLFIDPTAGISKLEKQLAATLARHYKPTIFVVNKWDLMLPAPTSRFASVLYDQIRAMPYAPTVFITAKTGKNMKALLNLAQNLFKQAGQRVATAELNRAVAEAVAAHPPPVRANRRPKLYFAAQVGCRPPTIVLFCNSPNLFASTYQRYLLSAFRQRLPFKEIPIKLYLRRRQSGPEQ